MKILVSLFVVFLSVSAFADGDYKHMKSRKKPVVSSSSQQVVTLRPNELKSYKSNSKATSFYKGSSSTTAKSNVVTNTAKQRGYKHQF